MSSLRKFLWVATSVVLMVILFRISLRGPAPSHQAPNIHFSYYWGEKSSLADYRNKRVVLLNFWASWCEPCMAEMPSLKKLEERLEPKGLIVIAINVEEKYESIRQWIPLEYFPKHLAFDYNEEDLQPYRISSIPVSIVVARSGAIWQTYLGPRDWISPAILQEMERVLAIH